MSCELRRPSVTLIVSHLSPVFGMERVALSVIQMLRKVYEVQVVCVGGGAEDEAESPGVRILGTSLSGVGRIRSLWRLHRFSRTLETDVVIVVGVWVAVPWLLVAGVSRRRTLVWEHSMMRDRLRHSRQLRALALAAKFLYQSAAQVVTVSRPLQQDIQSLCKGASIVTIPNPVQFSSNEAVASKSRGKENGNLQANRKFQLLTVGSLTSIKAQHLVIEALSRLDDSYKLVIVGIGPEMEKLVRLTDELEVASRVDFVGFLAPDEVRDQMRGSDMLVHCSVIETFGLVYVEAADAGLPVVSTRSPVAEDMIPKYVPGWVCEPDAESLALEIAKRRESGFSESEIQDSAMQRQYEFGSSRLLARWTAIIEPERKMKVP